MRHGKIVNCLYNYGARKMERVKNLSPNPGVGSRFHSVEGGGARCSGSSGRVRPEGEKHGTYAAALGGHLFYDLFSQGRGGAWPPRPPWIRYLGDFRIPKAADFARPLIRYSGLNNYI